MTGFHSVIDSPLSVSRVIPPTATIAGMFYITLIEAARRRGLSLPLSNARYLQFSFYPTADFARLLVFAAPRFYPGLSLREGLRKLGQGGPRAFGVSTLGKVTLGVAQDVHSVVTAIARTYEINTKPSRCEVVDSQPTSMILALSGVYHFLDSHHVGVFEGTLQHSGVSGSVRIATRSPTSADLLLEWTP